jgi:hypothetical protein
MNTARDSHTATLLFNRKVLVAGGSGSEGATLASAELYDTAAGTWSITGSLNGARLFHTATLLPDGKVLVAGGWYCTPNCTALASAELYNPATGTWTPTGSLNDAREGHTATPLDDGRVLVAGGLGSNGPLASAELYDPATGAWTATGSLNDARRAHSATMLGNGLLLVAGGYDDFLPGWLSGAELYDPATGIWTRTGNLQHERAHHGAARLEDGKVLVVAGWGRLYPNVLASAELYDPVTGVWSLMGNLNDGRYWHTATLLQNGRMLVAGGCVGGFGCAGARASAELYDPATGMWSITGNLNDARYWHTATLLPNGEVLVAGGLAFPNQLSSAELYHPPLVYRLYLRIILRDS